MLLPKFNDEQGIALFIFILDIHSVDSGGLMKDKRSLLCLLN